jgi:hypothetical protein
MLFQQGSLLVIHKLFHPFNTIALLKGLDYHPAKPFKVKLQTMKTESNLSTRSRACNLRSLKTHIKLLSTMVC